MNATKTYLIVPAYNEAQSIGAALANAFAYVDGVVVVDDGSTDDTAAVAVRLDQRIVVLRHRINLGKGAALKTGCQAALTFGAARLVFMDADGQHVLDEIPKLLQLLERDGLDIVFGTRRISGSMPYVMRWGNRFLSFVTNLLFRIPLSDSQCGFRALRASAYPSIEWESPGYAVETEMIVNAGKHRLRFAEVPIETIYRDKYKGTTVLDGVGIFLKLLLWRIL